MNYLRRMSGWKHQVVQELHLETDNIVLWAPPWEAQGLYWGKENLRTKQIPPLAPHGPQLTSILILERQWAQGEAH